MKSPTDFLTRFAAMDDPLNLEAYRKSGGYSGLSKALDGLPGSVVAAVKDAKLAGRGGAGFDAGTKWSTVPIDKEPYMVCNADEGEPGTFKDRFLLEKAPFLVLEGLTIAGYAVGAKRGFVYVRGEYPHAIDGLTRAISILRGEGLVGDRIMGSDFSFEIELRKGGGSYVVGDETALLNSLMGNRGYPLLKPPFPTQSGLWGEPTVINNVETLSCVPLILANGPDWFRSIGADDCPGPKLYSVSGHVKMPGVYEYPMGTTVSELIEAAGGPLGTVKAVQVGGTAGPIYDDRALPYPLDFPSMRDRGGALGSGALVVMNSSVNMVHVLQVTMRFFSEESCGQCFVCRYGTRQLEYMADQIALGAGKAEYLDLMKQTALVMDDSAFCPFGQSVRLPLLTLLEFFGPELEGAIKHHQYIREVV